MKKVLSLALAACVTLTAGFSAMAANTVEIETITVNGAAMTVNFNTAGLEAADQVTLLTYQADSSAAEATESNIKYIDQIDKAENTSISFNLASAASGNYQVKMGGTDVATPSVMSITVDENMTGAVNFMPNEVDVLSGKVVTPSKVTDQKGNIFILKPDLNYIATYAKAPAKEGYTVKAYGVRLNGKDYSASVELKDEKYAVLFQGAGVKADMGVTAVPYVVYTDGTNDITYFGTSNISVFSAK